MGVLLPNLSRQKGGWAPVGAASIESALADASDSTYVRLGSSTQGARLLVRFGPGLIPQDGDLVYSFRAERAGTAQQSVNATIRLYQGDPDSGSASMVWEAVAGVAWPRARVTSSRNLTAPQQHRLKDFSDVWVEVLIEEAAVEIRLVSCSITTPDAAPVGAWTVPDFTVPSTLPPRGQTVWLRMGDGRARKGKLDPGMEWLTPAGVGIEHAGDDTIPNARSVTGWAV